MIQHEADKSWKKPGLFFAIVCMFFSLGILCTEEVIAGTFDNAYTFYNQFGNEMVFRKGDNNQGDIYYAIVGKESTAAIRYKTIGWKVSIKNNHGTTIDTIYYDLKGNTMELVNESSVDGYNYQLYKVTLSNLKYRMSPEAKTALKEADCDIRFDSCTTTIINGVVQGGMSDQGPSWGNVYTTYTDLVNAQNWSEVSRELLKSFYDKEVQGLFYKVKLKAGKGIKEVSGAGKYCFGSKVTISATLEEGYRFENWEKDEAVISDAQTYTFTLYDSNEEYTANALPDKIKVNYHMGNETEGESTETVYYYYNVSGQKLMDYGWVKDGHRQIGWSNKRNATEADYGITASVSNKWIAKNIPEINLYAVWNQGPVIYGEDLYVSLRDAQEGKVDEAWFIEQVYAWDLEDGYIAYGKNENNSFQMINFHPEHYKKFKKSGYITERFRAVDSVGNVTIKNIKVHIVESKVYDSNVVYGEVRFISDKYYKNKSGDYIDVEEGGLFERSVWRTREKYRNILDKLFS